METILEICKFFIPAMIVFLTAYFTLKSYLDNQLKMRKVEALLQKKDEVLPLRLQAYERLVLLLERIAPPALITRLRNDGMTVPELQLAMISTIRHEFEHNYSQQIYVSEGAWTMIKSVIEELVSTINTTANNLNGDSSTLEFSRSLLQATLQGADGLPTERAIGFLKKEVQAIF